MTITSNLTLVKYYLDFESASKSAKDLARKYNDSVYVDRTQNGWCVLIPPKMADQLIPTEWEEDGYDERFEADMAKELEHPFYNEIDDEMDSYGRSEEEGWFYD